MKFNKKLLSSLAVLLVAPTFLFACVSGGSEEGKVNPDPTPTPDPRPEEYKGLKFTATQNNSKIGYTINKSLPDISIQYSTDGGDSWDDWDGSDIPLNNGESVWVRNTVNTLSISQDKYFQFTMAGKIEASGDVSSMINGELLTEYCYAGMFRGCSALTSAPTLPATTLNKHCYEFMFRACSNLVVAPNLPATTLAEDCYKNMFRECINLESAPELKAANLESGCYNNMFYGCTGLTSATTLPATTLKSGCYMQMFYDCSSLKVKEDDSTNATLIFLCQYTGDLSSSVHGMFNGAKTKTKFETPALGHYYYWYIEE